MQQMTQMYEAQVGRVVRLRSGSPPLTIKSVDNNTQSVVVTWENAGFMQSAEFPILCLDYEPDVASE